MSEKVEGAETQNDFFWRDSNGEWHPESDYKGDFSKFEGEWHHGWFARWTTHPHSGEEGGGDWVGPHHTEQEALDELVALSEP